MAGGDQCEKRRTVERCKGGCREQGFRLGDWGPPSNASTSSLLSVGGERGVAVAHMLITLSNNKCFTCNAKKTGRWSLWEEEKQILSEG